MLLTVVLTEAGDLAAAERVCAAGLARCRDAGDLWNQAGLLPKMAMPGPAGGPHPGRRGAPAGSAPDRRADRQPGLTCSPAWTAAGDLCAATGRARRGRHGVGRVRRSSSGTRDCTEVPPWYARRREEPLRKARQALGPGRARAAEERGAAMSLATAAEYALMLTDPGPPPTRRRAPDSSAPGNGSWSPWSPRAAPTPRSPPSCTSASARSARTWTGSGTRPAAAAAPT